jgi:hypothetical protein
VQVVRAFFDYLNEGPDPLMIADIIVCALAFAAYIPLCCFVSRAFGWTTFGALATKLLLCPFLTAFYIQLWPVAMITNDGFFTGFLLLLPL